jgi:hypothetical protein
MTTTYLGQFRVIDGYNGDYAYPHFCFDQLTGYTYAVYPFGSHKTQVPKALSPQEALWLINNHPICQNIKGE